MRHWRRGSLIFLTCILAVNAGAAPICEQVLESLSDENLKPSAIGKASPGQVTLWRRLYRTFEEISATGQYIVSSQGRPGMLVSPKALLPIDLDAGLWRQRGHLALTSLRSVLTHAVPLPHFLLEQVALSPVEKVFRRLLENPQNELTAADRTLLEKYRLIDRWNEWREWYNKDQGNVGIARKVYQTAYRALLILMFLEASSLLLTEDDSQSFDQYLAQNRIDLEPNQAQVVVSEWPVPYLGLRIGQTVYFWQNEKLQRNSWGSYLMDLRSQALQGQQSLHLATLNLTTAQVSQLRQRLESTRGDRYDGSSEVNNSASRMVRLLEELTPVRVHFYWKSSPLGVISSLSGSRLAGTSWAGPLSRLSMDSSIVGRAISQSLAVIEAQLWGRYFWSVRGADLELSLLGNDKSWRDEQTKALALAFCEKQMSEDKLFYLASAPRLSAAELLLVEGRMAALKKESSNMSLDRDLRESAECRLQLWEKIKKRNEGVL